MFTGSIPKESRIILCDLIKNAKSKDVYIGCSGNFSIDRIMSEMEFNVHSNDVSLYSKLISDLLLNKDTELTVTHPLLESVFGRWNEHRFKKLIQVMYAMRVSKFIEQKNPYEVQMLDTWNTQSVEYYEKTIDKLDKGVFNFNVQSFDYCDFRGFLKNKIGKGVGFAFPPTYKGGYEKVFSFVENSFDYERAKYDIYDPKNAHDLLPFLEEDENIFTFDREIPEFEKWKTGVVNLGSNKHDVFVYSSVRRDKRFYIEKKQNPISSSIPTIDPDFKFTNNTKIKAEICKTSDINYFKAFYMANKVNYTIGGDFGVAFYADGKAFGFASFSLKLSKIEYVFIQSDFVVNSHTDRLSKLLIMLLKTKEVRKLIARKTMNYYDGLKTTVYTDKPISMKYRGIFNLLKREKDKLIYVSDFIELNIKQTYNEWQQKQKK